MIGDLFVGLGELLYLFGIFVVASTLAAICMRR
jgi:hypothetical protein